MKEKFLKLLPFVVSIITGLLLGILGYFIKDTYISSLMNNIAAGFLSIPLIFVFYQKVEVFSKEKLNERIKKYCKLQIDNEVLSIASHIRKIIFPLKNYSYEKSTLSVFNIDKGEIINSIKSNKYLGFQVFKHWKISQEYVKKLLESPLILKIFDDDILGCIVSILKNVYTLASLIENKNLYVATNEKTNEYFLIKGTDFNESNKIYPDRYLLLKPISNGRSIVVDFGDLNKYDIDKCLNFYTINKKYVENFVEVIYCLIEDLKKWGTLTGNKLILVN